jgi:predicted acyl esterase
MGGGGIKPGMGVALETPPLEADVEVTGPLMASFWVSSESEDMDLFLTLRNFGADGNEILETGQQGAPVPVAKGWLRVSHRELDPALTLPYRPYHAHRRRLYLKPGEIVQVQVEIWPTSMVFKKGNRIRLDVQPRDGAGSAGYLHYHADYNTGHNTIHSGGARESYLLLPVIPAKQS